MLRDCKLKENYEWFTVDPMCDAFVVNLGDMLQILSNDKYRSVEHRAVLNGGSARMSVTTFDDPAKSMLITPASPLVDIDHPPLFWSIFVWKTCCSLVPQGPDGKINMDSLVIE